MKLMLFGFAVAAATAFLAIERSRAQRLRLERDQEHATRREWDLQQAEHARLVAAQPSAAEIAELQRALAARAERQRAIDAASRQQREADAASLPIGEWLPVTRWHNSGQTTPAATVRTMLWAAMGGDTARLQSLFHIDDLTQQKLRQLHSTLPPATRSTYPLAGDMMAAFTARAIPVGDAQIVWHHQSSSDEAATCVWVRNPDPAPGAAPSASAEPNSPPRQPANPSRTQALLTLRRFEDGWKIVVPSAAVDRLARELSGKQ